MHKKSSWRPISFATASPRSSTTPGRAVVSAILAALICCGVMAMVGSRNNGSKRLGADQPLGQQNGDRLAALEHHGERGAHDLDHLVRMVGAQHDDAHGL